MFPVRPSQGFSLPPSPPKRRRRQRTVYSVEQREELERVFENNRYPSYDERETLAARLNLQEKQVQVWFKNRRAKQTHLQQGSRTGQRGLKAQASSQGPGACASVPAPAPAPAAAGPGFPEDQVSASGPGFAGDPVLPLDRGLTEDLALAWDLLLSEDPMFSGSCVLPGGAGFDNPSGGVAAAGSSTPSHLQARLDTPQDPQDPGPAAAAPAPAPAPAPAAVPVCPEESEARGFWPDLDLVELLSL